MSLTLTSRSPSFSLFSAILDVVEEKHTNRSHNLVFVFLKAVLARPFPAPGESIDVKTFSGSDEPDTYSFLRPPDSSVLDYVSAILIPSCAGPCAVFLPHTLSLSLSRTASLSLGFACSPSLTGAFP